MGNLNDELSVDVAAETESFASNPANINVEEALENVMTESTSSDVEVPEGDFWDEGGSSSTETDDSLNATDDTSDAGNDAGANPSIVNYKANGKDVELDISTEAGKAELAELLSQAGGVKKAFTDKAKLSKRYKKLESENKTLAEYKETFDKLEAVKDDPSQLMELLTGENYEDFMAREVSKRTMYETGSDEDRRFLDAQAEIEKMKAKETRSARLKESDRQVAETKLHEARTERTRNAMTKEFNKYEFDSISDEATKNSVKEVLWESAITEVKKQYKQYGKLTNKMVVKAFEKKAKALGHMHTEAIENGVNKAVSTKKEKAKAQAQAASTRNYTKPVSKEISGLSPRALFDRIRKG